MPSETRLIWTCLDFQNLFSEQKQPETIELKEKKNVIPFILWIDLNLCFMNFCKIIRVSE